MIIRVDPVIDPLVLDLCQRPYPNHPKGCPNWGKKPGCPPGPLPLDAVLDLDKPVYAVCNRFEFGEHVRRMRRKHPDWSRRQVECCLYWQGTARKRLKRLIGDARKEHPDSIIVMCPEAHGVNVTATMRRAGVELEWPPVEYAWQVALLGRPVGVGSG